MNSGSGSCVVCMPIDDAAPNDRGSITQQGEEGHASTDRSCLAVHPRITDILLHAAIYRRSFSFTVAAYRFDFVATMRTNGSKYPRLRVNVSEYSCSGNSK